jgi:LysR family transcriptional repressor of citA
LITYRNQVERVGGIHAVDFEWLHTFVVAAEEQNFRKAAERLHLAQPTVTLHIQKLEERYGMALFERRGRTVRLSPGGRRLLSHAKHILAAYQASQEDMARWQQGYEVRITIVVSPLVATTYLPHWIRGFSKNHPEVEFAIKVKESSEAETCVLNQSCDLAFSRLPAHHSDILCEMLYEDPVVMVAPTDMNEVDGARLTAEDWIQGYTVFTHNHPGYWDSLALKLRRRYPNIQTMQVSLVNVTTHFIAEKLGVSFLPESTVRREILRGTVTEVPFDEFPLPVAHTYMLMNHSPSQIAAQFAEYVREYMKVRGI